MEASAFPSAHSEPPLPREYVEIFLKKATVLNELMRPMSDDYVRDFLEKTYKRTSWNRHFLKSFAILDYPLAAIEPVFRKERISDLRDIQAGLYPFQFGEVNACATLSPEGDSVIFFSEWLFAF